VGVSSPLELRGYGCKFMLLLRTGMGEERSKKGSKKVNCFYKFSKQQAPKDSSAADTTISNNRIYTTATYHSNHTTLSAQQHPHSSSTSQHPHR
jgi:hypothetical protein